MSLWSNEPNRTNHIYGTWDSGDPDEDGKYNLWQNTHYDWVRDDNVLKEAVLEANKINPALRTPSDLYKKIGSAGIDPGEDYNANFAISERSAIYQLGGLQFIAKHPDISNDSDYDFETANGYSVEILDNQTLLPKQRAKVQYGFGDGATFTPEVTFNVAENGFDGNQAKLEFVEGNTSYLKRDDRNGSEQWLRDAGYAGQVTLGNQGEISAWVAMQDENDFIKADYLDATTKGILGNNVANGNNKSIEFSYTTPGGVEHYQGANDKFGTLTQSGGVLTIPLKYTLNYQTSDSTIIDDHKARFGDPSSMYAALNTYDHVASGTTDLLGIDIKVTGLDGEAGNNKNIQVIVDTSLGSDDASFDGTTLTVSLSNDLTTPDGSGG
jgi:hypothetical protein